MGSGGGTHRDFMTGCPLAAAVLSCTVQADRWIAPHLAVRIHGLSWCNPFSVRRAWRFNVGMTPSGGGVVV